MPLYYDKFVWEASIPFDCPLCATHIPAGVRHECSNPKPADDQRQTPKPKKASAGQRQVKTAPKERR